MLVIESGTEAWDILYEAFQRERQFPGEIRKISFMTDDVFDHIMIKVNEYMWSPPLSIRL